MDYLLQAYRTINLVMKEKQTSFRDHGQSTRIDTPTELLQLGVSTLRKTIAMNCIYLTSGGHVKKRVAHRKTNNFN